MLYAFSDSGKPGWIWEHLGLGRCAVDLNRNAHRIAAALTEEKIGPHRRTGRSGGLSGGPARAAALSPERRKEIAVIASVARWKDKRKS